MERCKSLIGFLGSWSWAHKSRLRRQYRHLVSGDLGVTWCKLTVTRRVLQSPHAGAWVTPAQNRADHLLTRSTSQMRCAAPRGAAPPPGAAPGARGGGGCSAAPAPRYTMLKCSGPPREKLGEERARNAEWECGEDPKSLPLLNSIPLTIY